MLAEPVVLRIMGAIPAEARGPQRAEGLMQRDFAWRCPDGTSRTWRNTEKLRNILHRLAVGYPCETLPFALR